MSLKKAALYTSLGLACFSRIALISSNPGGGRLFCARSSSSGNYSLSNSTFSKKPRSTLSSFRELRGIKLSCRLRRFCEEIRQRFLGVHSFRHLNASLLINSGVDIKTVSASLGHSQVTTTLNIYAHTFEEAQARASEAVANLLENRKNGAG